MLFLPNVHMYGWERIVIGLAYPGIYGENEKKGCSLVTERASGTFACFFSKFSLFSTFLEPKKGKKMEKIEP